jgi:hypothetical protein
MASYLAGTYRRAAFTPQGVRYPIEVRRVFPCEGNGRLERETLAEKKLRAAKKLRDATPREPRLNN